jgi:hypothetical protein
LLVLQNGLNFLTLSIDLVPVLLGGLRRRHLGLNLFHLVVESHQLRLFLGLSALPRHFLMDLLYVSICLLARFLDLFLDFRLVSLLLLLLNLHRQFLKRYLLFLLF